jgi:dephospho-CoA kinase
LDVRVLVYCDERVRMERVMKRDNITKEYFLLRDKNGLDYNKEDFDYVIYNDNEYIEQLNELLGKIKK